MHYNKSNDKRHELNRDVVDSGFLEGVVVVCCCYSKADKNGQPFNFLCYLN
jgi:hypothetical protein